MKKIFHISILYLIITGCSTPFNKETYLKNFETFMSEVSVNYKNYSDKDWEMKNEEFEKFTGIWYEKFEKEFTLRENIKITGYQVKFQYYSALSETSSVFKEILDLFNVKEIKAKVNEYINNDMKTELKHLYEEASKAGKEAEEAINEMLKDLQVTIEEL